MQCINYKYMCTLLNLKVPENPNSRFTKEGRLANAVNSYSLLTHALTIMMLVVPTQDRRPHYSQGVVADSEHYLGQLPCFMERKDHSPG